MSIDGLHKLHLLVEWMSCCGKTILICLTAFLAAAYSQTVLAQTEPDVKQPINDEEFLSTFKSGELIEKRQIQASAIIKALQFAQDAARNNQALPARLEIRDSLITGNLESELLRETKVRALPPELRQRYRRFYVDGVRVVPVPIVITGTTFQGLVDLGKIVFEGLVDFTKSVFQSYTTFDFGTFETVANFRDTQFQKKVSFNSSEFRGEADFDTVRFFARADFNSATFVDQASFDAILEDKITFSDANFVGDADLSFNVLQPGLPKGELDLYRAVFHRTAEFRSLKCAKAWFQYARFRAPADFRYSTFSTLVNFNSTIFEEDVDFFFATFPEETDQDANPKKGLSLEDVRFKKVVRLDWDQLILQKPWWQFWREPELKVNYGGIRTWEVLGETFRNSRNLEGENEAMYQRRRVEALYPGYNWTSNYLSFKFWGYGIRPWRVIKWIVIMNLLFGYLYWRQTSQLKTAGNKWKSRMDRLRFTIAFTLKNFWKLTYGFHNSRTPLYKTLTMAHSILSKFMIICVLNVISHVSPLLNEIVGKLIPT